MPLVVCNTCNEYFYAKPNWIKKGHGKYCSRKCHADGQKTGKFIKCFICEKQTYKTNRSLLHSKSGKYFCGKSCQTVWRNSRVYIGENHPNWKHGKFAYRKAFLKSKVPAICLVCNIKDIRVLAVHHIDRNRKNNKIKNLAWLCHNCHILIHHYNEDAEKFKKLLQENHGGYSLAG